MGWRKTGSGEIARFSKKSSIVNIELHDQVKKMNAIARRPMLVREEGEIHGADEVFDINISLSSAAWIHEAEKSMKTERWGEKMKSLGIGMSEYGKEEGEALRWEHSGKHLAWLSESQHSVIGRSMNGGVKKSSCGNRAPPRSVDCLLLAFWR